MNRFHALRYLLLITLLAPMLGFSAPGEGAPQSCTLTVNNSTTCVVQLCLNGTCWSFGQGTATRLIPCATTNQFSAVICGSQQILTIGNCCRSVWAGTATNCCVDICLTQTGPGSFVITITPSTAVCDCVC